MPGRRAGEREVIALFPLGSVLVPGLLLPLQIFEPRYVALLRDLGRREPADRIFGVVAIRSGHEVGTDRPVDRYEVGTAAAVQEVAWTDDGRAAVRTTGAARFRVVEPVHGAPYRQALVQWWDEPLGDDPTHAAQAVRAEFGRYCAALGRPTSDLPGEPTVLSYAVAAAAVLDLATRQGLLEEPDTTARLRTEARLLRRERALLSRLPSLPAVDLDRTAGLN